MFRSSAIKSRIGDWSAVGDNQPSTLIVVDRLLERLSSAKLKPILNGCVPDSGFVAFRPFLRHPQATVVLDGGSKKKAVTSAEQRLLETDQVAEKKFVVDLLGFPGCLLMAYRMHGVAVMSPHDWWNCIVQCISQQIHLEHRVKRDDQNVLSSLQQFTATARVSKPSLQVWLREIEAAVSRGMAHKTELPSLLQRSFSTSTDLSEFGNLNSAVCAFKYRFVPDWDSSFRDRNFLCGLYGVQMLGCLEDWQHLRQGFDELCAYLRNSSEDYGIETPWMEEVQRILEMLVSTFEHRGRHSLVKRFWKSMVTTEAANCEKCSVLEGWLAFLFSCRIIEPSVDLRAVPIDFSVSSLPFSAEAFGGTADYELCTGIVGYSMKFDRETLRWMVEPQHECCLFKY